jgi:hypothetical protein
MWFYSRLLYKNIYDKLKPNKKLKDKKAAVSVE